MGLTLQLSEYQEKYQYFNFERRDGILQVTMHTDGSDLVWGFGPDEECGFMFEDIGRDPENKVIILTGSGDSFIDNEEFGTGEAGSTVPASVWAGVFAFAKRLLQAHLDIEVPMIAAINGPATIHAELALLCDIVLASETAVLADQPHFPNGLVPGDGVQVIWPMLIGMNRARYLMFTGQHLTAEQSLDLGLVAEVLPKDELLPRAWVLANQLLEQPPLTLRLTRSVFTSQIKQALGPNLEYGIAVEGLAASEAWIETFKRGKVT
ncbi:MAG: enoyl-CoA hydratase/isomerase family protein [Solirubrobacterales bacterium]|nr:enoyl-CoA hydratase/isomerase family protein [Solirubrobacterales bacterium]